MVFLTFRHQTSRHMMLMMYLCYPAIAFSATPALHSAFTKHPISLTNGIPNVNTMRSNSIPTVLHLRGGEEESPEVIEVEESIVEIDSSSLEEEITTTTEELVQEDIIIEAESDSTNQIRNGKTFLISPIVATLKCIGTSYTGALIAQPIITKALTACLTFGLSDWTAQRIESKPDASKITKSTSTSKSTSASKITSQSTQPLQNWKRTMFSAAVGLFYFGPAAHYWYEAIFKLLPATTLFSTVQKALLGQIIFGPIFTCVFFASSLLQDNVFTVKSWVGQIKRDLPGVWLSGLGYWPLIDMISYGLIPIQFIPLFINLASFVWTVYLSLVANSRVKVQ
mmetsp:Transcript_28895/g.34345  ORF Transcript_28895/g.34345 Transcript_28895/m.34345 type:complete len:339 (+) Transcript_28895:59-1075(+)